MTIVWYVSVFSMSGLLMTHVHFLNKLINHATKAMSFWCSYFTMLKIIDPYTVIYVVTFAFYLIIVITEYCYIYIKCCWWDFILQILMVNCKLSVAIILLIIQLTLRHSINNYLYIQICTHRYLCYLLPVKFFVLFETYLKHKLLL